MGEKGHSNYSMQLFSNVTYDGDKVRNNENVGSIMTNNQQ